jgi:hypothetical protein
MLKTCLVMTLATFVLGTTACRAEEVSSPTPAPGPVALDYPYNGGGHDAGHHRSFWAWLTYQPLSRPGLCGCCHRCAPCCPPPLYTFFLCNGYGNGGPGCAACAGGPH